MQMKFFSLILTSAEGWNWMIAKWQALYSATDGLAPQQANCKEPRFSIYNAGQESCTQTFQDSVWMQESPMHCKLQT